MIPFFVVFCLHFRDTTLRTRLFSHLQLRLCIRDVLEGTANAEDENPNPKPNRPPTKKPTKKTKKVGKDNKNTKKNTKNKSKTRSLFLRDEYQEDGEVEEEPNYYYCGKAFDSSNTDNDNDDNNDDDNDADTDDTDDIDDVLNYYYIDQNEPQLEPAVSRSSILQNFIDVDKLLELKVFGPGDVLDLGYSEGMVTKVCNV